MCCYVNQFIGSDIWCFSTFPLVWQWIYISQLFLALFFSLLSSVFANRVMCSVRFIMEKNKNKKQKKQEVKQKSSWKRETSWIWHSNENTNNFWRHWLHSRVTSPHDALTAKKNWKQHPKKYTFSRNIIETLCYVLYLRKSVHWLCNFNCLFFFPFVSTKHLHFAFDSAYFFNVF